MYFNFENYESKGGSKEHFLNSFTKNYDLENDTYERVQKGIENFNKENNTSFDLYDYLKFNSKKIKFKKKDPLQEQGKEDLNEDLAEQKEPLQDENLEENKSFKRKHDLSKESEILNDTSLLSDVKNSLKRGAETLSDVVGLDELVNFDSDIKSKADENIKDLIKQGASYEDLNELEKNYLANKESRENVRDATNIFSKEKSIKGLASLYGTNEEEKAKKAFAEMKSTQEALSKEKFEDLNEQEKELIDKERGEVESFFVNLRDDEYKQKSFDELKEKYEAKNFISKDVLRDLEFLKNIHQSKSVSSLILSADEKEKKDYENSVLNIALNAGFDDVLVDEKEGKMYFEKEGQKYLVNEGFFDNFTNTLLANTGSITGGLIGAAKGASSAKSPQSALAKSIAYSALGSGIGASADVLATNYLLDRKNRFDEMLHHALEESALSAVGDALVLGAKPLLKTAKDSIKDFGKILDYTPLVSTTKNFPTQNIKAAQDLVEKSVDLNTQKELDEFYKAYGGRSDLADSKALDALVDTFKAKFGEDSFISKNTQRLNDILNLNSLSAKQNALFEAIRADESGFLLPYVKEVASYDVRAFKNLKNILNLSTQRLESSLKNMNLNKGDIKNILDELEKGTKEDYNEVMNEILAKTYDDRFKVVLGGGEAEELLPIIKETQLKDLTKKNTKLKTGLFTNNKIAEILGLDTSKDIFQSIQGDKIIHTLNRHGTDTNLVKKSGQEATTYEDIGNSHNIVNKADLYAIKQVDDVKILLSAKQINGHHIIVESVSTKNNELKFKSYYKEKGKITDNKDFMSSPKILTPQGEAITPLSQKPSVFLDSTSAQNNYTTFRKNLQEQGLLDEGAMKFLNYVENTIYNPKGVTFTQLNNALKNINSFYKQSTNPGFKEHIKNAAQSFLRDDIKKGINEIFKQDKNLYAKASKLYETSLAEYAQMKELLKASAYKKARNESTTQVKALDELIKYSKGQGKDGLNNLDFLRAKLDEKDVAILEMNLLNRLYEKSLANTDESLRVFDSTSFLNELSSLQNNAFKSKEANEFIELVKGFDKLFKNDAKIALELAPVTAKKEGSALATSAKGAVLQKIVKSGFDLVFRNLGQNVLFGSFKDQIQGAALRYHLKKALQKSDTISEFNNTLKQSLKKGTFNSKTKELSKEFLNEVDKFSKSLDDEVLKDSPEEIRGENFTFKTLESEAKSDFNVKMSLSDNVRDLAKLKENDIQADLDNLALKHPEMFKKPSDVFKLLKEIKENPTHFYNNNRLDASLIVKRLKNDKIGKMVIKKDDGEVIHATKVNDKDLKRLEKVSKKHSENADIIQAFTQQGSKQENQGLGYQSNSSTNLSKEQEKKDLPKENINKEVAEATPSDTTSQKTNLKPKTTSKLSKYELDNLPIVDKEAFKGYLQKVENKEYENLPNIIKIATLNDELKKLINNNNSAFVYMSKARASHISKNRKQGYEQALRLEEQEQMQDVLNKAKEAYTGGGDGFVIPFKDVKDENKINLIVLNSDEKGNFLITAKKVNLVDFENPMYKKISPQTAGVEPATTTSNMKQSSTESISLEDKTNSSTKTAKRQEEVKEALKETPTQISQELGNPLKEFGRNYPQYYHKPQEAIAKLLETKEGQVAGAFHKEGLGDIDLVWGKITDAKNHKGYGLAHILDKHPDFDVYKIPEIIEKGEVINQNNIRYRIQQDDYVIGLSAEYKGEKRNFIITAFERSKDKGDTFTERPFTQTSDNAVKNLDKPNSSTNSIKLQANSHIGTGNTKKDFDLSNKDDMQELKAFFHTHSTDTQEAKELFNRVLEQAQHFKIKVNFTNDLPRGASGEYDKYYLVKILDDYHPEYKAQTLFHELIHSVTTNAIMLVNVRTHLDKTLLHPKQIEAVNTITTIYKDIKTKFPKFSAVSRNYGMKNEFEFIAELANPEFRDKLKKLNVFEKIVDAITKIVVYLKDSVRGYGKPTGNAYEKTKKALIDIIDNYDKDFLEKYINTYKKEGMSSQAHYNLKLESRFLNNKGEIDLSKIEGRELPKADFNSTQNFKAKFQKVQGKYGYIQTPYKEVKVNMGYAYRHFYQNTHNVNRDYIKGAFFDTFVNPLFVAKKHTDKGESVYFYNVYKDSKDNNLGIFGIGVDSKGNVDFRTLYKDGGNVRLKEMIKLDDENIVYVSPALTLPNHNTIAEFSRPSTAMDSASTTSGKKQGLQSNSTIDSKLFVKSPNIFYSNSHIGTGLASGTLSGLETDENGNVIGFNPQKFALGFLGGAGGSLAFKKGKDFLDKNPKYKEAIKKELADTLAQGFENASKKYPMLDMLKPIKFNIMQNEKGRIAQANHILNKLEQKEAKGLANVTYNGKNASLVYKDLENIDEAILYTKGNRYKGAKHIRIEHLTDSSKEGYIRDKELLNLGKDIREFLKYNEPFIDKNGARLYEWENKEGVRFRVVVNDIADMDSNPTTATEEIITFYSDRNLKERMKFKNFTLDYDKDYFIRNDGKEALLGSLYSFLHDTQKKKDLDISDDLTYSYVFLDKDLPQGDFKIINNDIYLSSKDKDLKTLPKAFKELLESAETKDYKLDFIIKNASKKLKISPRKAKDLLEWHKDSSPITKDKEGLPKVFYHGTDVKDLQEFEVDRSNYGYFFSSIKDEAKSYQQNDGDLLQTFLKIKNPFKADEININSLQDLQKINDFLGFKLKVDENTFKSFALIKEYINEIKDRAKQYNLTISETDGANTTFIKGKKIIDDDFTNPKNPIIQEAFKNFKHIGDRDVSHNLLGFVRNDFDLALFAIDRNRNYIGEYERGIKNLKDILKQKGYDGIKFNEFQYSVFDSKQIKHIDNKGSYIDSSGNITSTKPKDTEVKHRYFNENSPNIFYSNSHIGTGLASGSLAGLETDENGNVIGFNPQKFALGFLGGAGGSLAFKKGKDFLDKNPKYKEAIKKELADTLAQGFENASKKYPMLDMLKPIKFNIMQSEKGRIAQAGHLLNKIEKQGIHIQRETTKELLSKIVGQDITNANDGVVAQVSKKNISKMLSDKAIAKSVNNGFSELEHIEAVKDIQELYKKANFIKTHKDLKHNNPAIIIHRYKAKVDKNTEALITLKETIDGKYKGNKIYTLELEGLQNVGK